VEKKWYVVHTYSGYENKVKANLEKRVESMNMQDKIFRVIVPVEEAEETKNGKKKTVMRKIFPGYVLVEMIMTDDSWYVVRNTPGVNGFVGTTGSGSKPTPLMEDEAKTILKQMGFDLRPKIKLRIKQNVRVNEGPFANFIGTVEQIMEDKQKVKVMVNMFGRETPIELDFTQLSEI